MVLAVNLRTAAKPMLILRSLIFDLAFYVNLVVLMILGLPMMLFGRKGVFFHGEAVGIDVGMVARKNLQPSRGIW